MIKLIDYNKNPNIGVISRVNDTVALLPSACPRVFGSAAKEILDVEVINTDISGTSLLGSLIVMNNHGMLLPKNVFGGEKKKMEYLDMNIEPLDDKFTALGNLILLNDHGAIASKVFGKRSIKTMEDVLGCEVERGELAGFKTVGSVGVATNKGALIHPKVSEEELEWLEGILKVDADVGTVNRGVGYIRTGLIANSNGALIGNATTGPEIARIEDSLGFLR